MLSEIDLSSWRILYQERLIRISTLRSQKKKLVKGLFNPAFARVSSHGHGWPF